MAHTHCPTCGRAFTKRKTTAAVPTAANSCGVHYPDPCPATCRYQGDRFSADQIKVQQGNLEALTSAELFAHFKKTAPIEDVRFALRVGVEMPETLRADWQALLEIAPTLTRAETYKRLEALRAQWRRARAANHRAKGIPAVGVGRSHDRVERARAFQIAQQAQREYIAPKKMRTINGQRWRQSEYRARLNPERLVA